MRYLILLTTMLLSLISLGQSSIPRYFDIPEKNMAIHVAKTSDSAYYLVKNNFLDTAQQLNWNESKLNTATDLLVAARILVLDCMEKISGQDRPVEYLVKTRNKLDDAIEELEYLTDYTSYMEGKSAQSSVLSMIKYSSASAYHASLLIKGIPEPPPVEEVVDTSALMDSALNAANRIQTDSALFNKLMRIYKLELDELWKREKELMMQLEDPDLSEAERTALENELARVQADITEREQRIASGRAQLENLDEEKKVVNNYISSLSEYEEWEAIENFPYELDVELPKGLVFRVQIGYYPFRRKVLFEALEVDASRASKKYVRYYSGFFRSYKEATAYKEQIREEIGIEDAFLVSYFDGEKVNIKEAIEMEDEFGPTQD